MLNTNYLKTRGKEERSYGIRIGLLGFIEKARTLSGLSLAAVLVDQFAEKKKNRIQVKKEIRNQVKWTI